jgi:hypothetical protein
MKSTPKENIMILQNAISNLKKDKESQNINNSKTRAKSLNEKVKVKNE